METLLKTFKNVFLENVLSFLWKQWTMLGVAGHEDTKDSRIIDPEALLLFSLTICRYDPRLFDEIIDWLQINGRFINVQRLRNLMKTYEFSCLPQLSAIAELLQQDTKYILKWKSIASKSFDNKKTPLFYFANDEPIPITDSTDEIFKKNGLLRGKVQLRGLSKKFSTQSPSSLLLKLRSFMGVNARCEILCILATCDEIHPSEVARQTGYIQRTIQSTMVEMSYSGIVIPRKSGKEKYYRLKPGILDRLIKSDNNENPEWINWAPFFSSIEKICLTLIELNKNKYNNMLLSSELKTLMKKIRNILVHSNFDLYLNESSNLIGEKFIKSTMNNLNIFIDKLKNKKVFISHTSKDKDRFVTGFARKLRKDGVDAWLDEWEIDPGDSLVERIFSGISDAEYVIVILSKEANTPWVNNEIENAFVRMIDQKLKIIPILIDKEAHLPECIKHLLWIKINDIDNYEQQYQEILDVLFDRSNKPPLGNKPDRYDIKKINNRYSQTENIIMKETGEMIIDTPWMHVDPDELIEKIHTDYQLDKENIRESLKALHYNNNIKCSFAMGNRISNIRVLPSSFEKFCEMKFDNYDEIVKMVISCIVNKDMLRASLISKEINYPLLVVKNIIVILEMQGYLTCSKEISEDICFFVRNPGIKKLLM